MLRFFLEEKTVAENQRNRHTLLAQGESKKREGLGENTPGKETFTGKRSIAFCSPTNVRKDKITLHSKISRKDLSTAHR